MVSMVTSVLTALVLSSGMLADSSNAAVVRLVTADYRFEPSELTFHVGTAYHLHVENHSNDMHELTAPAFFEAVELKNPEVLNQERTELVLQPGEQKDVYFIAKRAGRYPYICADHDWAGMTGVMVVE